MAIQIPQSYNVESELIESLLIGNRAGRVDFLQSEGIPGNTKRH